MLIRSFGKTLEDEYIYYFRIQMEKGVKLNNHSSKSKTTKETEFYFEF